MEKIIVGTVNSVNNVRPDKNGNVVVDSVRNAEQAGTLTGNLGFWHFLHRFGDNFAPPTTNKELNQLGIFASYFTEQVFNNQPAQYGQLINIPANLEEESTQLWIEQDSGKMYHRGGNRFDAVDNIPFRRFLDTDDISGYVGNQNAWWVKFSGAVPLIIQGGKRTSGSSNFSLPIAFPSKVICALATGHTGTLNQFTNISSITTTQLSVVSVTREGRDGGAHPIFWLAIGV